MSVGDLGSPGLKGGNPTRYGELSHPGDAFAYDVFTQTARTVADDLGAEPTAPHSASVVR